jgi:uncharacterized membrane protein
MNYAFALAFGIGVISGLRSLLAPAAIAVAIFSILAIGELVADKLPKTPKRTAFAPLLARMLLGGLSGASLCAAAGKSLLAGALLGGTGAVVGAFVGYEIRRRIVNNLHIKDFFVAICEDFVAIALAFFFVWH